MDSPTYVLMAESMAGGERSIGYQHHGYPALIAGASLVLPGRELPGRAVSLITGVALMVVVYALARMRLAPGMALIAPALVALHPLLAVYSGPIMSDSPFLLLAYGGLLLLELQRTLAAGLALGLAYVVRPEAAMIATFATPIARPGSRTWFPFLVGLAVVSVSYAGYLRWNSGEWTITPKSWLVRPMVSRDPAEFRAGDATVPRAGESNAVTQTLSAIASNAKQLVPRLGQYGLRVLEAWPWPLLALSLIGLVTAPSVLLAPIVCLVTLALVPLQQDIRYVLVVIPALAVGAALGAQRLITLATKLPPSLDPAKTKGVRTVVVAMLAISGLVWSWVGPARARALHFDDAPMAASRAAGRWLAVHGRPGASVMDRKAYVPFYAGMRHVQLGDDDYDTIVESARSAGVDYLVVEEFVADVFRPQLIPLLRDPIFRASENRLRTVYAERGAPGTGIAIFEVVRDSTGENWAIPR
jgi:hypothetical protein